jgi:trehalose 6-phosphate phosphatase
MTRRKDLTPLALPSGAGEKGNRSLLQSARLQLEMFLQSVTSSVTALLMLDYDGTLAPFHEHRNLAAPYPGVSELLRQLMETERTRIVIISGRDANEIPPLLGLNPCPEMWGLHGLQSKGADGAAREPVLDERTRLGLDDAQRWLRYQGLMQTAETKGASLALHWRGREAQQAEEWRNRALLGWAPIARASGLKLLEFDGGIEICAPESDKGAVVRALLQDADSNQPAAYLGDDSTDEHAFRALAGCGLSVLVRPRFRKTAAQLWLQPPDDLIEFLQMWLEASQTTRTLAASPARQ